MGAFLTTRELLELLKVDRTTIHRMLNDGRLSGVKVGGQWRFQRSDVEILLGGAAAEPVLPVASSDILPLHCVQAVQDVFAEIGSMGARHDRAGRRTVDADQQSLRLLLPGDGLREWPAGIHRLLANPGRRARDSHGVSDLSCRSALCPSVH